MSCMGCKDRKRCSGSLKKLKCGHTVCEEFAKGMLNGSSVQMVCPQLCSESVNFTDLNELEDVPEEKMEKGARIGGSDPVPIDRSFKVVPPSESRAPHEAAHQQADSDEVEVVEEPTRLGKRVIQERGRAKSPRPARKTAQAKESPKIATKSASKQPKKGKQVPPSRSPPEKKPATSRRKRRAASKKPKAAKRRPVKPTGLRSQTALKADLKKKAGKLASAPKKASKKTPAKTKASTRKDSRNKAGVAVKALQGTQSRSRQHGPQIIEVSGNNCTVNINR